MIHPIFSGIASVFKACTTHRADWTPRIKTTGLNVLICGLSLPLFVLASILHWILWLSDECFFPAYKNVTLYKPVFIIGIPRSGTTHLLRTLALNQPGTTCCTTQDWLTGPTLSGQAIFAVLKAADEKLGRLFSRGLRLVTSPFQKSMSSIHTFSWDAPEEDFVWLWPLNACFLGFLIAPNSSEYWSLAYWDTSISPTRKNKILTYYKACIQKKLYGKGEGIVYLSKNPSFSLWMDSLKETFPGARFIFCTRDLQQAIASQLSSLEPAFSKMGIPSPDPVLQDRFTQLLSAYDRQGHAQVDGNEVMVVSHDELKHDLKTTILRIAAALKIELSQAFREQLTELNETSAAYQSEHDYSVEDTPLTAIQSDTPDQEKD